ncbi:MAG: FHA domain-containing protein [Solirubrobacteraceae bacterium]
MTLALRCTEGALVGQQIEIDRELVLGRGMAGVANLGGDTQLSRRHARVYVEDHRLLIEDLGSTNGTFVNDQQLTAACALQEGDRVRCGKTRLEVFLDRAAEATQPAPPTQRPASPRSTVGAPHLEILAGALAGQSIPLGAQLAIGRGYGEPGALGGDRRLSRRHARIARTEDDAGGLYYIEDSGSTNGTTLNGQQLRGSETLRDGDQIELGSTRLVARGLPAATPVIDDGFDRHSPGFDEPVSGPDQRFIPQGAASTRLGSRRLIVVFAGVFLVSVLIGLGAVLLASPPGSRTCPNGFVCHKPPTAPALRAQRTFAGALGWHAEYNPDDLKVLSGTGSQLVLTETDRLDTNVFGVAAGTGALAIVVRAYPATQESAGAALQAMSARLTSHLVGASTAPSSDQLFGSPVLGLHPAIGRVLEGNLRTPQGPGALVKAAAVAATSGRVTLAAGVLYGVRQASTQQSNPDLPFDQVADQMLETVRFPSDGAA